MPASTFGALIWSCCGKVAIFNSPSSPLLLISFLGTLSKLCWLFSSSRRLPLHKSFSTHSSGPRRGQHYRQGWVFCRKVAGKYFNGANNSLDCSHVVCVHPITALQSQWLETQHCCCTLFHKLKSISTFLTHSFSLDCFSTAVRQSHFFVDCFLHMTKTMSVFICCREQKTVSECGQQTGSSNQRRKVTGTLTLHLTRFTYNHNSHLNKLMQYI